MSKTTDTRWLNFRIQLLVYNIADYLSDWTEDETELMSLDENINQIEEYGVSFFEPSDILVRNAIRHLIFIMNPMNKATVPDILVETCGFSEDEAKQYFGLWLEGF